MRACSGIMMLMFSAISIAVSGQNTIVGMANEAIVADCDALNIISVSKTDVSACEQVDGQLRVRINDQNPGTSLYTVSCVFGHKIHEFTGLPAQNGVITLSGLYPGRYEDFRVTNESANCRSAEYGQSSLIHHGCDLMAGRTGCGTGTVSYTNCESNVISVSQSNFSANTYIFLDDDYVGCIGFVNGSCQIQPSMSVFCLNYNKTAPTPAQGYPYGTAIFTRVVGAANAGYSELTAERINWVICNGTQLGYTEAQMNSAIWYLTGTNASCNTLCGDAISAVPSAQGGIEEQMIFYIPNNTSLQPFVERTCITAQTCNLVANAGSDKTICSGGSTTLTASVTSGSDCNQYAQSIAHYIGNVTNVNASVGAPDGTGTFFSSTSTYTRVVWDMGQTISSGSEVCLKVKTSTTGTTNIKVWYGVNGINPSSGGYTLISSESFSNTTYQDLCVTLPANCRYIKITYESGTPFYVDAVSKTCPCTTSYLWSTGATTATITVSPASTTTYTVTVTQSGCGVTCTDTDQVVVNVTGTPSITAQPVGATICTGGTHTMTVTATGGNPPLAYQWQSSPDGTAWTNISGATNTSYTTPSLSSTTRYRVIVSPSGTGCSSVTSSQAIVTVVSDPAITTQPTNIIECVGGQLSFAVTATGGTPNLEYQWQSSSSAIGPWTNISGATLSTYKPASTTAGVTYYKVIVDAKGNGCGTSTSTVVSATIVADPSITTHPVGATICGGGTHNMSVTAAGGTPSLTYQWQSSPTGSTWTNISGATTSSYTTSALTSTVYYRVIVSASGEGCGSVTSNSAVVNVDDDITISAPPGSASICSGSTHTMTVAATGGIPPLSYQWQSSPNGSTWTNISGATTTSYTTPTLTTTTYYRVLVSSSGTGCGSATSSTATVTVNPYPQATFTSTQAGCSSNNGSITFNFPDNPNFTQIQFSLNGGSTYQTAVADNSGSVTYSNLAAGTYNLYARWGTGVCPVSLGSVTISNTAGPLVNIACQDDPILNRTAGNSSQTCGSNVYGFWSGNLVSNWTSQQHWSVSGGSFQEYANGTAVLTMTATNNANANLVFNITAVFSGRTYSPPAGSPKESTQCIGDINNSNWYYYTSVNGNMIGANALAGGVVEFTRFGEAFQMGTGANLNNAAVFGASGWLTFDIKKHPSSGTNFNTNPGHGDFNMNMSGAMLANTPPDCLNICVGESTSLTANAASGTAPYSFLWSNGSTSSSITVSPATTTTYSVTVTDDNGCTATDQATVTVYPVATVNAGPDQTICVGATVTMAGTIGGAATSATWTSSVAGGSFNPNATTLNAVYTPPAGYTGVITMTLTTNDPAGSCPPAVDQMIITIIADPSITVQPVGATICDGSTHTMTVTATGGTPSLTYQWQSSPDGTTWTNISGATNTTYTTPALTSTTRYRVVVNASGAGCGSATSNAAIVTVVADPSVTVQPVGATICDGGTHTMTVTATGGTPSLTYQWQSSPDGTTWTNISGATNTTYTTPALTSTTRYRVVVNASGAGCGSATSNAAIVTVVADPSVTVQPVGATICDGGTHTMTVTATGGTPSLTYQWQSSPDGTTWTNISEQQTPHTQLLLLPARRVTAQ
ncbi:MAG: hypothetical protein IPN33_17420 [Saprospiraceae bacterium]|nr:hypothetical protein [Saprospiraceae bacterium]